MGTSARQGPNIMQMTPPDRMLNNSNSLLIGPQHGMPQVAHPPTTNAMPGPGPMLFSVQSTVSQPQGGSHSFQGSVSMNAPLAIPRPQQPSSSDFTFQPHRPPASQVWPSGQPPHHSIRPPVQAGHGPFTARPPLVRPLVHNLNNPPVHGFPRHQVGHQVNQPRPQIPPNFAGTPMGPIVQPRNLAPPHRIHNTPGPFPPRPDQLQMQENQLRGMPRPQRFLAPHPHYGNHPGRPFFGSSGPQQVYDPFSPTAASLNPQKSGNVGRVHGESDAEYEDLMSSVGVK